MYDKYLDHITYIEEHNKYEEKLYQDKIKEEKNNIVETDNGFGEATETENNHEDIMFY